MQRKNETDVTNLKGSKGRHMRGVKTLIIFAESLKMKVEKC